MFSSEVHDAARLEVDIDKRPQLPQPPFSLNALLPRSGLDSTSSRCSPSTRGDLDDDDDPAIPLIAASYRTRRDDISIAKPDDVDYLNSELNVDRLNNIHEWLWIVGRPMPPRPLHLQRRKSREVFVTEQMDLHLTWSSKRIYIKPIPRFLLDADFWKQYLCTNRHLYECALGFLLSYTALIQHQSDYRIAIENQLLPKELTWPRWVLLVEQLLSAHNMAHINKRYVYGELRLGRLNLVYRFTKGRIRGYLSSCTTYADFLRENFSSLLTLFAYFTIVLSAMQVGLGTQQLQRNAAFNKVSYGFVVFAMIAPPAAVMVIVALLLGLSIFNLMITLAYRKQKLSRSR